MQFFHQSIDLLQDNIFQSVAAQTKTTQMTRCEFPLLAPKFAIHKNNAFATIPVLKIQYSNTGRKIY